MASPGQIKYDITLNLKRLSEINLHLTTLQGILIIDTPTCYKVDKYWHDDNSVYVSFNNSIPPIL